MGWFKTRAEGAAEGLSSEHLFAMLPGAAFRWRAQDNRVQFSAATVDLLGFTAEELRRRGGPGYLERVAPGDRESLTNARAAAGLLESWECRYSFRCNDGIARNIIERGLKLTDGDSVELVASLEEADRKSTSLWSDRLGPIVEASPDSILLVDRDGLIVRCNQRVVTMFGYEPDELVGHPVENLIPDEVRERHQRHRMSYQLRPVVRDMGATRELFAKRKDGTQFMTEVALSPLNENANTLVLAVVRDVTDRREAQVRATRREQQFRALLDAVPDALFIVDDSGAISRTNTKATDLFGYAPDAMLGKSIDMLIPDSNRDHHASVRRNFMRAPRSQTIGQDREVLARHADGHDFRVEVSVRPVDTGDGQFIISTVRDVTERDRMQDQLRRSTQRLQLAMRAGAFTPWEANPAEGIFQAFGFYASVLGFAREELGDTWDSWASLVHEEDLPMIVEAMESALARLGDEFEMVFRMRDARGEERWVEAFGITVRAHDDGDGLLLTGLQHDVTARQRAQTELAVKIDELEQFNRTAIGRELRMVELKQEVNRLCRQLGQPEPYAKLD